MTNKPVPEYTASSVEKDLNGIWMQAYANAISSKLTLMNINLKPIDEIESAMRSADAVVRAMLGHRVRNIMAEFENELQPKTEPH